MTKEKAKKAAAIKALEYVKDGMLLGLGSGSTSYFFIEALIQKKFNVKVLASSEASEEMAKKGGLALLDHENTSALDLYVDGADQVDAEKRLIKGAGGALVREKILATMSKKMVVIVDESKMTQNFERILLPVEVIPFCPGAYLKQLEALNLSGQFRQTQKGQNDVTDNHNWIIDLTLPSSLSSPELLHEKLLQIPGVVDTGFFFGLAQEIIIGYEEGKVQVK